MPFTEIAIDLLAIAEKRNEAFGNEISALGDDTWQVLLKLYVNRHSKMGVLIRSLENVMQFPRNLDRILSVLLNHNLVEEVFSKTGDDQVLKITDEAVSKIHLVLDGALGSVNTTK
ncbi:hypothetical protein A8B75_03560 [Sphingomonadales bacterium EhC05]|nr:hypothetical protein A8B75_03560 [Sphingomonadales bacterium EhC05]